MAGYEYPPRPVSYLTRDVLLYANSIGVTKDELHFLYEKHPNFQVFPTFPTVLAFKGDKNDVIDTSADLMFGDIPGAPPLDESRGVDGEKYFKLLRPLPVKCIDETLELRTKVIGVYDKGQSGTVVERMISLVDKRTGEPYSVEIGSAFFLGQGGWGGPKGSKRITYRVPTDRNADATHVYHTSEESALLYRLNGDYNPLHADPVSGKRLGFDGAILHGLATWNMVCHALLKIFGGSQAQNLREFQARFSSPVLPGETIITQMWKNGLPNELGLQEVLFETKSSKGTVLLTGGRAIVKLVTVGRSRI